MPLAIISQKLQSQFEGPSNASLCAYLHNRKCLSIKLVVISKITKLFIAIQVKQTVQDLINKRHRTFFT